MHFTKNGTAVARFEVASEALKAAPSREVTSVITNLGLIYAQLLL
jgi:hypothetical protein